ncbi:hypothetical protein K0M31_010758 [Melipona bicolor]|uniref:Uncharacterized protein n=1 Tax=Melipona bicolor TaxID=60889 RepID=A0AA40KHX3_9HYME|nr:hypothetical protein K0M31_010758 [Melipona bicolor]
MGHRRESSSKMRREPRTIRPIDPLARSNRYRSGCQHNFPLQRPHEARGEHIVGLSDRREMAVPVAAVPRAVRRASDRGREHHGGQPRQGPHQQRDGGRARREAAGLLRGELRIRGEQHAGDVQQRHVVDSAELLAGQVQADAEDAEKRDSDCAEDRPRHEGDIQMQGRFQDCRRWAAERLQVDGMPVRELDR